MLATRCTTVPASRRPAAPASRPRTASGGLQAVPRLRLSRLPSQAHDASGKIASAYDRPRRCSHLLQSDNEIVVNGKKDKPFDWSKLGSCLGNSALNHYGLGGATAASGALAIPIPKAIVPPYRVIGSPTTNLLSVLGRYAEITVPRVTIGGLGSTNLLRIAGRANPYVAAGLLAVDAAVIGYDTYQCYNNGGG